MIDCSPEKAGVGGSIPSLATMFSITYRPSPRQFHSVSFQNFGLVASKIPILLIRLGLKHFDSGLAIMGFEHAESTRPIPVLADHRGRMDEPTTAVRHRLPSRRESSSQGTAWRPTASAQRRSAT